METNIVTWENGGKWFFQTGLKIAEAEANKYLNNSSLVLNTETMTFEEPPIYVPTLEELKAKKQGEIYADYDATIKAGFIPISIAPIRVRSELADIDMFKRAFDLLELAGAPDAYPQNIRDFEQNPQVITKIQLRQILVELGMNFVELHENRLFGAIAAIDAATTAEAVAAIQF